MVDTSCPCRWRKAVNFNARRADVIDMLVLHYTGMQNGKGAENWLCVEESQVSCHYLVYQNGEIVQMVAEADRAWHAGVSSWRGHEDINSRSIGIEIVNGGHEFFYPDFPAPQIEAVIALCLDILSRQPILDRNVVAHSDIAPMRKRDPGEKFPWEYLARSGIGHYLRASPIRRGTILQKGDRGRDVKQLQMLLSDYGYGIIASGIFDHETEAVVTGFQRHFRRQKVDGIADASTLATLKRLLSVL